MRALTFLSTGCFALLLASAGCASLWTPRVPGARYARTSEPVPVHSDRGRAALHPEAYAIGHAQQDGRDLGQVIDKLATLGRANGAHAMLLDRQEATVSSWTTVRTEDGREGSETGRRETLSVDSAQIVGVGVGYRVPQWCVGALLVCEPIAAPSLDGATCEVRVRRLVETGPLADAALREGEIIDSIGGVRVRSPSDVFARADLGEALSLGVRGEAGSRSVAVTPRACAGVYPRAE